MDRMIEGIKLKLLEWDEPPQTRTITIMSTGAYIGVVSNHRKTLDFPSVKFQVLISEPPIQVIYSVKFFYTYNGELHLPYFPNVGPSGVVCMGEQFGLIPNSITDIEQYVSDYFWESSFTLNFYDLGGKTVDGFFKGFPASRKFNSAIWPV